MQRVDLGLAIRSRWPLVERLGCAFNQLAFPLRDLIRMHVELLGQIGERAIALNGGQRYLGLEGR